MTAAVRTDRGLSAADSLFLGFGAIFRKELVEWLRGPKAAIVAGIAVTGAIFMTLIPFLAVATGETPDPGLVTNDPTTNVLLGWTGTTAGLIVIIATMSLLSAERDRGTLAWSLSNPVSPTAILAAKFVAAVLVLAVAVVALPLAVSSAVATVAYGAPPDLAVVGTFGLLYLTVPVFFVAVTLGLGAVIRTTAGVAGAGLAILFVPQVLGGLVPVLGEASPTSIGAWAMAVATVGSGSPLTLVAWTVAMVAIVVAAKLAFDRQEV